MKAVQDYEPFGSLLPGRNYSATTDSYRFGFNGKEKDDEVHAGTGTSYDFGERLYDPRIGRTPSLDPKGGLFPGVSYYSFAANNPVFYIDRNGEYIVPANDRAKTTLENHWGTILTTASGNSVMADVLASSWNGTYYDGMRLDAKAYKAALRSLDSKDQKRLTRDYYKAIKTQSRIGLAYVSQGEEVPAKAFGSEENKNTYGGRVLDTELDESGSAMTIPDGMGNSTVVIRQGGAPEPVTVGGEKQGGSGTSSEDETTVHEVLGHGLMIGLYRGQLTRAEEGERAIQISNIFRRTQGLKPRNGWDHEGEMHITRRGKQSESPVELEK